MCPNPYFCQITPSLLPWKKVALNFGYFCHFEINVNTRPRGENSPNLVTLTTKATLALVFLSSESLEDVEKCDLRTTAFVVEDFDGPKAPAAFGALHKLKATVLGPTAVRELAARCQRPTRNRFNETPISAEKSLRTNFYLRIADIVSANYFKVQFSVRLAVPNHVAVDSEKIGNKKRKKTI
jgi:hypothetical protein